MKVKLDYKEIWVDDGVILQWGNEGEYIECKISQTDNKAISKTEIKQTRNAIEKIIEIRIKELYDNNRIN